MRKKVPIRLTPHAKEKLKRLTKLGVTKKKVVQTVRNPDKLVAGYLGRKIAQSSLSPHLVLRVVYEETDNKVLIITMYPGERRRYQ